MDALVPRPSEIEDVHTDQLHLDIWYQPYPVERAPDLCGVGSGAVCWAARKAGLCPASRDHDDDVSLAEACRKLNEVIGLKGMSRCGRAWTRAQRVVGAQGLWPTPLPALLPQVLEADC